MQKAGIDQTPGTGIFEADALDGEVFKLPVFQLGTPEPLPGIDGRKMSKSYDNTIPIMAKGVRASKDSGKKRIALVAAVAVAAMLIGRRMRSVKRDA